MCNGVCNGVCNGRAGAHTSRPCPRSATRISSAESTPSPLSSAARNERCARRIARSSCNGVKRSVTMCVTARVTARASVTHRYIPLHTVTPRCTHLGRENVRLDDDRQPTKRGGGGEGAQPGTSPYVAHSCSTVTLCWHAQHTAVASEQQEGELGGEGDSGEGGGNGFGGGSEGGSEGGGWCDREGCISGGGEGAMASLTDVFATPVSPSFDPQLKKPPPSWPRSPSHRKPSLSTWKNRSRPY